MTSTLPPIVQAFSGAVGSASANALTYPLDLVITRLQLDSPKRSKQRGGVYGAKLILTHILRKYGWRALYDGLWPDTCAQLLSSFFYFYFYSFLRGLSTKRILSLRGFLGTNPKPTPITLGKPHKPSMMEELVLGFIAGVASRLISTPLNVVTLRVQTEREDEDASFSGDDSDSDREPLGVVDVIKAIYAEEGLAGFWRGFQTTTILSLNPSLTFMFLQLFRRVVSVLRVSSLGSIGQHGLAATLKNGNVNPNHTLSPGEAFLGGALSNSIAVFLLYPLMLAKKRLQATSSSSMTEVLTDAYLGRDCSSSEKRNWARKGKRAEGRSGEDTDPEACGVTGLYQGLEVRIMKGFLSQGVTFLIKGRIEQLIVAEYLKRRNRL